MRVLLVAHELSAVLGSEAGSAYQLVTALSKYVDVTVIYAKTNQLNTQKYYLHNEREMARHKIKSFAFKQVNSARLNRFLTRLYGLGNIGFSPLYFVIVKLWEFNVYLFVRKIAPDYDVIHHVNHITFREPSFLTFLPVPVVLGPKSGTDLVKIEYFNGVDKLYYFARNLWIIISRISPFQLLYYRASMILAVSKSDAKYFEKFTENVKLMLDTSLDSYTTAEKPVVNLNTKIAIWIGRVDKLKALDIFIEVARRSEASNFEFRVVGEGPLLAEYMNMEVPDNLLFLGGMSRAKVQSELRNADILLHTSLKEASSAVIMEALENDVQVVAHDAFGMSSLVSKGLIRGVRYQNRESSIRGFCEALSQFKDTGIGEGLVYDELTINGKVAMLQKYYSILCES